jgi:hypothetical protein
MTTHRQPSKERPADVLVVFGISGDLAKVMTFRVALIEAAGRIIVDERMEELQG